MCFIFTSTTETLGLVLYEAMASGLPVMAADSPATREALEQGNAGMIFDPTDSDALLEVAHGLLYDEALREKVQSRARHIVSSLDWVKPTKQLLSNYERLLSVHATGRPEPIQDSTS